MAINNNKIVILLNLILNKILILKYEKNDSINKK